MLITTVVTSFLRDGLISWLCCKPRTVSYMIGLQTGMNRIKLRVLKKILCINKLVNEHVAYEILSWSEILVHDKIHA